MKNSIVLIPNSLSIPSYSSIRREYTRSKEFIDDTYAEKYDDKTIFYDVFKTDKVIYFIGPPLLNFEPILENCVAITDNNERINIKLNTRRLERNQISWIDDNINIKEIIFDLSSIDPTITDNKLLSISPSLDYSGKLDNSKILMTLQLNNDLNWIKQWGEYYSKVHGVDTIIIYDNKSTLYTSFDLQKTLEEISGLNNIIIVKWDFKYGPQGQPWSGPNTPWDSDFCQIGALQDMRFKFSLRFKGFINADIDEFFYSLDGINIFDALENSENGVIGVIGNVIVGHPSNTYKHFDKNNVCFTDFWERKIPTSVGGRKWAGSPRKWKMDAHPTAHWVRNISYEPDPRFSLAHFRCINNGWKIKERTELYSENIEIRPDFALLAALSSAFPEHIPQSVLAQALCDAEKRLEKLYSFEKDIENLQSGIILRTEERISWNKRWIWKNNVLVFEINTKYGTIAYDVFNLPYSIRIHVSVRDKNKFRDFSSELTTKFNHLMLLSNNSGFNIGEIKQGSQNNEAIARWCGKKILEIFDVLK